MPFMEGQSLRQRLKAEIQLGIDEAIQIVREVASALSFAHSRGVVHRDVKPENILFAGTTAVLSDFGIALVNETAETDRLTARGIAVGTPGYMSPEQTRGLKVSAASDLYSLACVLYEMLVGQPPFTGATAQSVLARHELDPVPSMRTVRSTIPDRIELAVSRALAKVPTDRFRSVADFVTALMDTSGTQRSVSSFKSLGRGDSLVVIPFVNIGSSKDEWLADGITEELITALSTLHGIRVLARTTSFGLKGRYQDVRAIGDALNTGRAVEGSVRKSGRTLRVVARLIDTADGRQKWSASYDRQIDDVLALQTELSRSIITAVRGQLISESGQGLWQPGHPEDIDAYELYLKGRFLWNKREQLAVENALSCFKRAVSRVPYYTKAYVGIADCYIVLTNWGFLKPHDAFPKAKDAIDTALRIDPGLPEAQFSRANVAQSYDWDWYGAEKGFKRGLELDPSYATGRQWYGLYLAAMARPEEARAQLQTAMHLDPLSPIIATALGTAEYYARQFDRSIEAFKQALELDPTATGARAGLGEAYLRLLEPDHALTELESAVRLSNRSPQAVARLARARAKIGQRAEAECLLEELIQKSAARYVSAYFVASVHASLGRADDAFSHLEKSFEERSDWLMDLGVDPAFEVISADPRFGRFLNLLKLPYLAESAPLDSGLTTAEPGALHDKGSSCG
jgi:serine/threonine-protein kinase